MNADHIVPPEGGRSLNDAAGAHASAHLLAHQQPAQTALQLTDYRCGLGLEAAWEIDAIKDMVDDLCDGLCGVGLNPAEQMKLSLQMRGLMVRVSQLAGIVMSVLSDDDDNESLHKKLHGRSRKEVAYG